MLENCMVQSVDLVIDSISRLGIQALTVQAYCMVHHPAHTACTVEAWMEENEIN